MSDLKLMEGEGSGYDLVFEKLARDAKPLPEIETDFTKVSVTIRSHTINQEVISILDYVDSHYQLNPERIHYLRYNCIEEKVTINSFDYTFATQPRR